MIAQFLSRRPQLAAIVSNAGWLIGERAFTLLTGFAVNVWFVRYLGPEQYGSYAYALSYTALFAAIASLGLETIVIRDLAKEPERAGDILGTALAIRGMAGAAAYLLIVASSVVLARGPGSLSLIAIVAGSSLFQGVGVFDYWFQANVSARPAVIARATVTLATHAVRCGLIVLGAPIAAFAVVLVASAAAATAAVYLVFRRHARTGSLAYQKDVARALLRDAWPLVIAGIAVNVYMRIDQVMLGNMTTAEETGIYAVAVNLSELWWIFPGTVTATVFPMVVRARASGDPGLYERTLQTLYDAMAAGSYVIAIAVTMLADPIVRILMGSQYLASTPVLRIHVWTLVFVALGLARSRFLVAEGLTRFSMAATVAGGVLNVVLNLVLIPRYGAEGSAWATLVAQAFASYASGALSPRLWSQTKNLSKALLVPFRLGTLRNALQPETRE